jgi:acetyltransferase-like isoleucine patch superfamily enzyme
MLKRIVGSLVHRKTVLRMRLRILSWRATFGSFGSGSKAYPLAVAYARSTIHIGANVTINDFVHIWGGGGVTIGDGTMIAAGARIISQTHDANALLSGMDYTQTSVVRPIVIGRNVWIGSNACILPGVVIGDNSIVAAGSVVTRNVARNTVVAGVPARTLRMIQPR